MKKFTLLYIGALIFLGACSSDDKNRKTFERPRVEADTLTREEPDTLPVASQFSTTTFSEKKGDSKLVIDYPESGNPVLLDSIRTWISLSLGGSFRGNMDSGGAFFRHYLSQLGQDPEMDDDEFNGTQEDEFKIAYKNDVIVTYRHKYYEYLGGAHGSGGDFGTTFLMADGRIFSKSCFSAYKNLHAEIVSGLKRYFSAKSDSQLLGNLIGPETIEAIPMPALDPWITEEGVNFAYTQYEIAPYSAGTPHFVIPAATILPYLNESGKAFFTGTEPG